MQEIPSVQSLSGMTRLSFDLVLLQRVSVFIRLLFPEWKSPTSIIAYSVLFFGVADQIATYYLGLLPKQFHLLLGRRDEAPFRELVLMSVGVVLFKAAMMSLTRFLSSLLYLKCREGMALILHRLYFKRMGFYRLTNSLDNPDHRMTQDVDRSARLFACDLLSPLLLAPFVIAFYTYQTYASSGLLGPVAVYSFFIGATVVSKILISPTVSLVADQERREGDLRARHTEVRANLDPIAFFHSGFTENVFTNQRLVALLKSQLRLIKWQFWLNLATNIFDCFGGCLSYIVLSISIYVQHNYPETVEPELNGIIAANAFVYVYLINCFIQLIALSQTLGIFGVVIHRVVELYEELQRLHADMLETDRPPSTVPSSVVALASSENGAAAKPGLIDCVSRRSMDSGVNEREGRLKRIEELHGRQAHGILDGAESELEEAEYLLDDGGGRDRNGSGSLVDDGVAITLESASVCYPNDVNKFLILNLSLQIVQGRNLLVTGDSDTGKTSLFRVLAGLWNCVSGRVERHWKMRPSELFFLPQKPYFPSSNALSLRQQLVYPLKALPVEKDVARLSQILEWIKLENLLQKCNGFDTPVEWDWNELSASELQSLSIGRVLYHRPRIAFLDEATSSLGYEMESHLYRILHAENITYVSIGHQFSLKPFHDIGLHLSGGRGGGWTLIDLETQSTRSLASQAQSVFSNSQNAS